MDIHVEPWEDSILQNIYVAKVKDVVPNIQSAFVDIKPQTKCYLSLADCEKPVQCNHVIHHTDDGIVAGDEILVQVVKEAIKTKDPTVSTKLSISGKYVAISYPNNRIGYSNKLSGNEKRILKESIASIKDSMENTPFDSSYGYVFRTNCKELLNMESGQLSLENRGILIHEIRSLTDQFDTLIRTGQNKSIYSVLYQALPGYLNRIRNISAHHQTKIITDDEELFGRIRSYFGSSEREQTELNLQFYQDASISMDRLYRLKTCLTEATGKKVWLKSGGYLIIEPTEALTVIDVNSGKYTGKKNQKRSPIDTSLQVNLEAAAEVARQLRLRNLSGIIIVDFINMENPDYDRELLQQLKSAVQRDVIKTNVIDMTPLGLVEMTRKKVEAPLWEQLGKINGTD
ncbi:MAG: ribonuclease E/G [Lachnospiraceae bacterium]|nr:ribonuclease E/G [Lachnospiraceae bacterium]